ncbi:MAG: sigma-70 family RNA polymerase sigma factor [candidate division KSB1 bacterium]|nr:sigma-70 family RNA polymerase sigma factor [candidate division KSB1 bacterium]
MDTKNEQQRQEFENVALEHMDSLYSTALRYTHNVQEAEDLVQDTYMRAYRFFDKYQKGTNFRAWIFRIMTNTFINKYRKKKRQPQKVELDKVAFSIKQKDEQKKLGQWYKYDESRYDGYFDDEVSKALSKLSDYFRIVVLLADVEGFTYKEIAKIIDRPNGTVMSRLFRGRRILKNMLSDYAKDEGYAYSR